MIIEVKVPSPGESISEVQLANWLVEDGSYVEKDQEIAEIDSDKATLSISAAESGTIRILVGKGETIEVGSVVAKIETDGKAPATKAKETPLKVRLHLNLSRLHLRNSTSPLWLKNCWKQATSANRNSWNSSGITAFRRTMSNFILEEKIKIKPHLASTSYSLTVPLSAEAGKRNGKKCRLFA